MNSLTPFAVALAVSCLAHASLGSELFDPRSPQNAGSFNCGRCGKRTILVDRLSDQSADHPQALIDLAYKGYLNQMIFESTFNCVMWLDSWREVGPPMGDTFNWDYELWGAVTGQAGDYKVRAVLVTACDHEGVAEGSSSFTNAQEAFTAGSFAVLGLGGSSSSSTALDAVLDGFEAARRDSSRPAWNAKITALELKDSVKPNEKQTIKIEVKDCDDKLLEGAPIEVRHSGSGTVGATEARTDASGQATVEFAAPGDAGEDTVTFIWDYRRPSGRWAQSQDYEVIATQPDYRLRLNSAVSYTSTSKTHATGTMTVAASFPLVRPDPVNNPHRYTGSGHTRYSSLDVRDGNPQEGCTTTSVGTGAPISAELIYGDATAGTTLTLVVGATSEAITVTCPNAAGSQTNALWFGAFMNAHNSEMTAWDGAAATFKLANLQVNPPGSSPIVGKSSTWSATEGDVTTTQTDSVSVVKDTGASTTAPRLRHHLSRP